MPAFFDAHLYDLANAELWVGVGLLIFFGLTVVLFSFILNGARHTYNDTGNGLTLKSATALSNIAVWGPIPLAVLFWIVLFATGRVSL